MHEIVSVNDFHISFYTCTVYEFSNFYVHRPVSTGPCCKLYFLDKNNLTFIIVRGG